MKICPNCQTEAADDVMFCANCGTNLANVQPDQPAEQQPAEQQPAEQQPANTPAFCPACGAQLAPGATFCPACGNQIGAAPKAPAEVPAFIGDSLNTAKTFVKNPDEAVGLAAKNKGIMWTIFGGAWLLVALFAITTCVHTAIVTYVKRAADCDRSDARDYIEMADTHSWGLGLVWDLLLAAGLFFALGLAIYAAVKFIHKKDISFNNAFNVVGVALLPMTAVLLVDMAVAILWTPIVIFLTSVACLLSIILLYQGFTKLAETEKPPIWSFICTIGCVVFVLILIFGIVFTVKTADGGIL